MYHECEIKSLTGHHTVPVDRFIKIDGMLVESNDISPKTSAELAAILYNLPMHPMTPEELNQAKPWEGDGEMYCIVSAAIVAARICDEKKIHPPNPRADGVNLFVSCLPWIDDKLLNKHISYLIIYIHNHFHNGPRVPLPPSFDD